MPYECYLSKDFFLNLHQIVKFIKTESRMEVKSYDLMGTVSVWEDEGVLEMDGGAGCTAT